MKTGSNEDAAAINSRGTTRAMAISLREGRLIHPISVMEHLI